MKKLLKISAVFILLLVVAIVVTPFFFKDKITSLVKEEINKTVNAKVDFEDVGLSLLPNFPNFTFSLEDFSVVGIDKFAGDTLFATSKLSLTLDLSSVFSGNYQVTKILIDKSVINLLILKDESANWDIAKESESIDSTTVEGTDDNAFNLTLKSFEMRNANIIYSDLAADISSDIRNLNLELNGGLTANNSDLNIKSTIEKLTYKMDNISYLKNAKIDFNAKLLTDLDSMKFSFKDNDLLINGLMLKFDGFVAMPNDIYVDIKYSAPQAELKSLMSLIPAFYMEGFEDIKANGDVAINGWAKGWYSDLMMPSFDVNIIVKNGNFQYPDLPQSVDDIQIATKIYSPSSDLDKMQINVSKFHFKIAKNPMDINLKLITPMSDPDIDANFIGKFDLASISKIYPLDDGMNLSGVFKTNLSLKGKQSAIDNEQYSTFKASGTMEISDMNYKDKDLPEGVIINKAAMNFNPRYIDLSSFTATYNKNTIEASGRMFNYIAYALSDGTLKANFKLSADYLDFNKLMASSELDSNSQQENPQTGNKAEETVMEAFDVPDNIDFNLQCVVGRITYDNINMKTVFGNVSMANKRVSLDNLKMEMLGGNMEMNGYYSSLNIDSPEVAMVMSIIHFDFKKTYQAIDMVQQLAPIMQYIDGDFTSLVTYNGNLDKFMNPDLKTVTAKGLISTSQLNIIGAKSVEKLATTLKINELKKLSVDPTSIAFKILDGKLLVDPFKAMVNGMQMKAEGITYLDQNIDYDVNLNIPREKLGSAANNAVNGLISQANAIGANISLSDNIDVNAKITGTTTKPEVTLDFKQTKSTFENAIQDEINKQTDELKRKAQEEADRLKQEMEKKAQAEIEKQKLELERKKKEEEAKLKKKLEEEAKKKLNGWF